MSCSELTVLCGQVVTGSTGGDKQSAQTRTGSNRGRAARLELSNRQVTLVLVSSQTNIRTATFVCTVTVTGNTQTKQKGFYQVPKILISLSPSYVLDSVLATGCSARELEAVRPLERWTC